MSEKIFIYQDYNTEKIYFVQAKTLTIAYQKMEIKVGFCYTETYLRCIGEIQLKEFKVI